MAGLLLLAAAYFSPIWWVSLKAPQYPEAAFPQGIRIHFHMDGVFNGCKKIESDEKYEEEALNCKHEMDAINHYVGMYPIAAGGPVEKGFSPFLFSLLGLMVVGFVIGNPKVRGGVVTVGCIALAGWMTAALQTEGGMALMSPNYIQDVTTTMELEPEDYVGWSGLQAIQESYTEALGRYFRDKVEIERRVTMMMGAADILYWAVMAGLALLAAGVWRLRMVYWIMILLPAVVPVAVR